MGVVQLQGVNPRAADKVGCMRSYVISLVPRGPCKVKLRPKGGRPIKCSARASMQPQLEFGSLKYSVVKS
jgi:hypothetical protein